MRFLLTAGLFLITTYCQAAGWSYLSFNVDTLSTTTFVQPLLIDASGRRTGLLGPNGPQINEIPNSGYTVDANEDEETGDSGVQGAQVGLGPVVPGQYTLVLFGTATTQYEGSITGSYTNASISSAAFQGFIVEGSSRQYSVDFNPTPGSQFITVKMVTFDSLRQELQAAAQLKQVGGKRFVDELDDILAQGEKALERKDRDRDHRADRDNEQKKREAIEALEQFVADLARVEKTKDHDESDRDHHDGDIHERGDEGRGRDLGHEPKDFVTQAAYTTLTDDAQTLIHDLGGEPEHGHEPEPGGHEPRGPQPPRR